MISNSTKGKPILQLVAAPLGPKLDAGSRAGTPAAGHAQASPRKHGGVDKKGRRKKAEGKSKRPESVNQPNGPLKSVHEPSPQAWRSLTQLAAGCSAGRLSAPNTNVAQKAAWLGVDPAEGFRRVREDLLEACGSVE